VEERKRDQEFSASGLVVSSIRLVKLVQKCITSLKWLSCASTKIIKTSIDQEGFRWQGQILCGNRRRSYVATKLSLCVICSGVKKSKMVLAIKPCVLQGKTKNRLILNSNRLSVSFNLLVLEPFRE
jgi:hypothetical protein